MLASSDDGGIHTPIVELKSGTVDVGDVEVGDVDIASVAAGASPDIGATTDAEATGNGSIIGILKRLRTLLAGTLMVQPFDGMLEGGLTELVGINEEVNTDDYGGSVGVALAGTYSGEILQFTFYATEDGTGAVQDSAGVLYVLDAGPAIAAGDTAMTAAERVTVIGHVTVNAGDWVQDANGGSATITDQPVAFHSLSTLYFVWFHTDAVDLNDAAGDDEQLEFNFWYRRDS
jgi:hypothetical protein